MPERSRSIGCGLSFARTCQGRLLAGALFSVFALLPAGCRRHTSDKTMISFFHEHEGAFERLVNFAQHDAELHAVTRANVCVKRGEQDWTTGGPQLIARKRWSDYQALFRELELPDGFAKDDSKISFELLTEYPYGTGIRLRVSSTLLMLFPHVRETSALANRRAGIASDTSSIDRLSRIGISGAAPELGSPPAVCDEPLQRRKGKEKGRPEKGRKGRPGVCHFAEAIDTK